MLQPYLRIWDWDLIFGRAVKAISSPGVRSPWIPAASLGSSDEVPVLDNQEIGWYAQTDVS